MKRNAKLTDLKTVAKCISKITLEDANSGCVEIADLAGKIVIETGDVLRIQMLHLFKEESLDKPTLWPQLVRTQSTVLSPVKFILDQREGRLQLCGELPLAGSSSLPQALEILERGVLDAMRLMDPKRTKSSDLTNGRPRPKGELSTKEIASLLAAMSSRRGYELSERDRSWTLSFNTERYFQRINIGPNARGRVLQFQTNLAEMAPRDSQAVNAISLFLLQASARLRFVRGILCRSQQAEKTVAALEVILPFEYAKIFGPEIAIESLRTATRYTRLACEALSQPDVAEEYLKRWPPRHQEMSMA